MSVGAPAGGLPSQNAFPSRSVSVAWLRTPINEYRDHAPPCSADSSRKVFGKFFASFLYMPSGVSPSANNFRNTGITLFVRACSRNSSRFIFVNSFQDLGENM